MTTETSSPQANSTSATRDHLDWAGDPESEAMLACIGGSDGPVGARQLRLSLSAAGLNISESTAARRLRDLDELGLSRQVGIKGRVITAAGAEVLARRKRATNVRLIAAADVRTASELFNLLHARRAIEPEMIRDATTHITSEDINDLRRIIMDHRKEVDGGDPVQPVLSLEFHRRIAEPATNPIVRAMHRLVLDSNLQNVDATLDAVLNNHDGVGSSVDAHARIVDAMESGDAIKAARLMHEHIETLIRETEDFIAANGTVLITHLLRGTWNG